MSVLFTVLHLLQGTDRYAGFLLAPAEGFGLQLRFFAFEAKKNFLCCFCLFVVFSSTPVTLSRNFSNLKKKNPRQVQNIQKYQKSLKLFYFLNPIKILKNPKNQLKKL